MGDRANYGFVMRNADETNILWLYLHWGGYDMADRFARALENSIERWGDEPYAIRMTVQYILNDLDIGPSDLGSGLSVNFIGDNEHTLHVVDFGDRDHDATVSLYDEFRGHWNDFPTPKVTFRIMDYIQRYRRPRNPYVNPRARG
jgi:hypothetical protein